MSISMAEGLSNYHPLLSFVNDGIFYLLPARLRLTTRETQLPAPRREETTVERSTSRQSMLFTLRMQSFTCKPMLLNYYYYGFHKYHHHDEHCKIHLELAFYHRAFTDRSNVDRILSRAGGVVPYHQKIITIVLK